jgi:predicted Fe-Mo cluster-binding NifX family protein
MRITDGQRIKERLMKIAITSQGTDLKAEVDFRFGRCQYFIIYDTETGNLESLENPGISAGGGAGIQTAQTISDKGVEAVLTGNVGPNAFQTLSAAGIKIYAGVSGKVSEAIDAFKSGSLKLYEAPSVESHFGMGKQQETVLKPVGGKRIAVAAEDDGGLKANVSAHFGRCPYYAIVEIEGDKIVSSSSVENPFYNAHGNPGQVPSFIHDQSAKVIIAGGMGQRAVGFFNEFEIEAVTGASGKVEAVVEAYLNGSLKGNDPCVH